jgi:hypothetical protein
MSTDENTADAEGKSPLDRFLLVVLGILGLAMVPAGIAWLAMRVASTPESPQAAFPEESFPAQGFTLTEYRREMETRLHGLGWIDREKGIAHVPIEVGIQLVLAHGLPAREEAPEGVKKQ